MPVRVSGFRFNAQQFGNNAPPIVSASGDCFQVRIDHCFFYGGKEAVQMSSAITTWAFGVVDVRGYTPIVLMVMFFGALNTFAIGIVGSYLWRTFENTKGRPQSIILMAENFGRTQ